VELVVIDYEDIAPVKMILLALDVMVDAAVKNIHNLVRIMLMKMAVEFVVALDKPY
jgi:hypothetical protein